MRSLCDLLTTWENWSARDTLIRALGRVGTHEAREALCRGLAETPEVDPLDALRDAAELVALLSGWQWQAMYAARVAGSTWEEIGAAVGTTGARARTNYIEVIDGQERHTERDATPYRHVL